MGKFYSVHSESQELAAKHLQFFLDTLYFFIFAWYSKKNDFAEENPLSAEWKENCDGILVPSQIPLFKCNNLHSNFKPLSQNHQKRRKRENEKKKDKSLKGIIYLQFFQVCQC